MFSFYKYSYLNKIINFIKEDKISPEPESVDSDKKKKKKKKKQTRSVLQLKLGKLALQIGYVGK